MCTVVLQVPEQYGAPIRVLAVRDEDPQRAWDPPGQWWQADHPGVVGVRDRRAGGAWLAADSASARFSVILNRGEPVTFSGPIASRGGIVLDSVAGNSPTEKPHTATFNLVEVSDGYAVVTMWDGTAVRRETLQPGVHMIAHDDLDDARTARIRRWLGAFAELRGDDWRAAWLDVLRSTADLGPNDDRAIIRDNRPHGYPTLSLLVALAEVGAEVDLRWEVLEQPGQWQKMTMTHA